MRDGLLLRALDGANPLAFLTALGTLRLANNSLPEAPVELRWERCEGSWRPRLRGIHLDEDGLCELLIDGPWAPLDECEQLGKNITVTKETFADFVLQVYEKATRQDRRAADFAAAFGSEICEDREKGRIEYTRFCFITGSGHQDFLGTIAGLASQVSAPHLRDALFGSWRVEKGLSMRWDPSDATEYALRWGDPGPEGARAVWGANRLAFEALPYFPAVPTSRGLHTTGFRTGEGRDEFTWPIWSRYARFETVRALVALPELQERTPERAVLAAMGVDEVYRSQRDRIGQGANFKWSFRAARAV